MNIILDLAIIGIVVWTAVIGSRRGFVRTAIELAGYVIILTVGLSMAEPVANKVYDSFVRQAVEESVTESLTNLSEQELGGSIDDIAESIPDSVTSLLELSGVSVESLEELISSNVQNGTQAVSKAVSDSIAEPIKALIRIVFVSLLFGLGMMLIRILARMCNSVATKLPIVGKLNKWLGAAAGALKGAAIAMLIVNLVSLIISLTPNGLLGITTEVIESTEIFSRLDILVN